MLNRVGYNLQPISIEFKCLQLSECLEESVRTLSAQFYARQVQAAHMLEHDRQLRQIAQLQAIEAQHGVHRTRRAAQPLPPAVKDSQGTQPAGARRRHPASALGSARIQPTIQTTGERFKSLLPFGYSLTDLHRRCPALAHLLDHLQGAIIGEIRF
ncbi:hypothetical protein D3C84_606230 [compost metagenome]